jgi:hypothetical protein
MGQTTYEKVVEHEMFTDYNIMNLHQNITNENVGGNTRRNLIATCKHGFEIEKIYISNTGSWR